MMSNAERQRRFRERERAKKLLYYDNPKRIGLKKAFICQKIYETDFSLMDLQIISDYLSSYVEFNEEMCK